MAPTDQRLDLTPRQHEVLATITRLTDRRGYPPTIREIGAAMGLASPSTVHHHVRVLERAGLVSRSAGRPRARIILDPSANEASNHQAAMI